MAVINLSVTIPNAQVPRLQAAARGRYGQVSDATGGSRDMTDQEIVDRLRAEVIQTLRSMVISWERAQDALAAEAIAPALSIT